MTLALLLLATVAALLAVALWWIRRTNLAVYPAGRAPRELRPLNLGCELGAQLMAAADPGTAGGSPGPATGRNAGESFGGAESGVSSGAGPASAGPKARAPRRKAPAGPSRREFLRGGLLLSVAGWLTAFGGASLAFLWPNLRGGFGAQLDLGTTAEVAQLIADGEGRYEYPAGRTYLVEYNPELDPTGEYAEVTNGAPFMALYQKCVHLGCRVPWCASSRWFECPCHGSRYNRWGEYRFGPAPRGLDRFPVTLDGDSVIVNTATVVTGPSRQTNVLRQDPEGPHCNG